MQSARLLGRALSGNVRLVSCGVACAALLAMHSSNGWAVPIPTLYNTGVDDFGSPLADNDPEPHYELIPPTANPPVDPFLTTAAGGFPIPPWLADTADFDNDVPSDSRWISPTANTNAPPADYYFEVQFDLSRFDHTTATISGGWSADNPGIDIVVNGTSTGQQHSGNFGGWEAFNIPTDLLVADENSIVFVVQNAPPGDNPIGLRVDFAVKSADPRFILGDFNSDTFVNTADFHLLRMNFLTGTDHSQGDMDFDFDVDLTDFILFREAFNAQGGAAQGVPEPGGSLLLAVGATLLAVFGRRQFGRRGGQA